MNTLVPIDVDTVVRHVWSSAQQHGTGPVYAILDTARHEAIYPMLQDANVPYCCLFRGAISPALAAVAPYLVRLHPRDPFTRWMFEQGWWEGWAIFLTSTSSMRILRRHFRRFLMVKEASGRQLYFRYYDPWIWQTYLPTCTEEELGFVFGPVDGYVVEGGDPTTVVTFSFVHNKLSRRVFPMDTVSIP